MNIGDKVQVELVGEIVQIERNAYGNIVFMVEYSKEPELRVMRIPAGACTLIEAQEDAPIVGGDGST